MAQCLAYRWEAAANPGSRAVGAVSKTTTSLRFGDLDTGREPTTMRRSAISARLSPAPPGTG